MNLRSAVSSGVAAVALAVASMSSQAAVLLSEGFDNVSGLGGSGWSLQNNSSPLGTIGWFQGNSAVFPAASGAPEAYAGVNFNSALTGGRISNWLITPEISLDAAATLAFDWRVAGDGYLDTLEIYLSTSGASTDVGSTSTSTGVFSLLRPFSASTDAGWVSETVALSAFAPGTTGRLAFRYFAEDNSIDSNYLGLDNVNVSTVPVTVPEPAPAALIALALAGMVALRRRG